MNSGANFLRDCVLWLNDRPEYLNDGKTHLQLINDWKKETGAKLEDYQY